MRPVVSAPILSVDVRLVSACTAAEHDVIWDGKTGRHYLVLERFRDGMAYIRQQTRQHALFGRRIA